MRAKPPSPPPHRTTATAPPAARPQRNAVVSVGGHRRVSRRADNAGRPSPRYRYYETYSAFVPRTRRDRLSIRPLPPGKRTRHGSFDPGVGFPRAETLRYYYSLDDRRKSHFVFDGYGEKCRFFFCCPWNTENRVYPLRIPRKGGVDRLVRDPSLGRGKKYL